MLTVMDCPNIAGAKASIAPVLNTPLIYYNLALPIGTQISKIEAARKYKIVNLRNPSGHACCLFALRSLKPRLDF